MNNREPRPPFEGFVFACLIAFAVGFLYMSQI